MIKKIKLFIVAALSLIIFTTPVMAFAASDIQNSLCQGTSLGAPSATGSGSCSAQQGTGSTDPVANLIKDVINIFSWVVGSICVIMIIYGGFRYVTSGGNDSNISGAKNTIIYALIGLVIVALSQVIVYFVLGKALNVNNSTGLILLQHLL